MHERRIVRNVGKWVIVIRSHLETFAFLLVRAERVLIAPTQPVLMGDYKNDCIILHLA